MGIFQPPFTSLQKKIIQDMIDETFVRNKRRVKKKEETPTKQQILILHYLGVINHVDLDNTKKAKLFSRLLNRNEQNIRTDLTYVNALKIDESDIKTPNNLKEVKMLFKELGMNEIVKKIDADLAKLDITE